MANAILFDIMTGIKSAIVNRGLIGIGSENIRIQKVPVARACDVSAQPWPGILIAPWGAESIDPNAGTDVRDDIDYPVIVAIVAADENNQENHLDQYLSWRQSIRSKFHNQRLTAADGTTELAFKVLVRPLDIVDRDTWMKLNLFVSGLLLTCTTRETRG